VTGRDLRSRLRHIASAVPREQSDHRQLYGLARRPACSLLNAGYNQDRFLPRDL